MGSPEFVCFALFGSEVNVDSEAHPPTNPITAIIKRKYRMPAPYASRHACSRTDATLFWTCIKIAKALKD